MESVRGSITEKVKLYLQMTLTSILVEFFTHKSCQHFYGN